MTKNIIWLTPDRFDLKPDKSTWIEMIQALNSNEGFNVKLLTSKSKIMANPLPAWDKFTIYVKSIDLPLIFRFSVLFNMFFWLRKNATSNDIILINQDALLLIPFLKAIGIVRVHLDIRTLPVDMHTVKDRLDKFLFWDFPLKWIGHSASGYSFITDRLKQELDNQFDLKINSFTIWQSGVNTRIFHPLTEHKIQSDRAFCIFYHGTISINRGIGIVIQSLALIEKKIPINFVIAGDGSGLEELKQLTHKLSLTHKVFFRGLMPYEEMAAEISHADICVCPLTDRLEWNVSSPIKVFEYMACGKPMILTPIHAHKDLVENAAFVVWTKGFDPIDFKNAIVEAIENSANLENAAKLAPNVIKANYEWGAQAKKLGSYLNDTFE